MIPLKMWVLFGLLAAIPSYSWDAPPEIAQPPIPGHYVRVVDRIYPLRTTEERGDYVIALRSRIPFGDAAVDFFRESTRVRIQVHYFLSPQKCADFPGGTIPAVREGSPSFYLRFSLARPNSEESRNLLRDLVGSRVFIYSQQYPPENAASAQP